MISLPQFSPIHTLQHEDVSYGPQKFKCKTKHMNEGITAHSEILQLKLRTRSTKN